MLKRLCFLFAFVIFAGLSAGAQNFSGQIRVNQVGYYPKGEKIAAIVSEAAEVFYIKTERGAVVFKGKAGAPVTNPHSGKVSKLADFSALQKPGKYYVEVPALGRSPLFEVKNQVHDEVARAALKAFYYQRASTELSEKYAGKWARAAGHADTLVLVHASAVSPGRPENFIVSAPKGWYDAGDYNKYIVNSGITMGTLLSLYEDFPKYFQDFNTHIPESNNGIPDLLDEVIWNLQWMLTMQDPADGGVYHKLTNPRFDGIIMPDAGNKPRYVVQKNTIATLNFVAVMAQAARIFKNFKTELPGLTDACKTAAVNGWAWAKKNPKIYYNQDEMNKMYDPDILSGAYGDRDEADEWIWASAELFALTQDSLYLQNISFDTEKKFAIPSWSQVRALGYYTLLRFNKTPNNVLAKAISGNMIAAADELVRDIEKQPYHTVMGKTAKDFVWGSSAVAANQGILLINTFKQTKNKKYLTAAGHNLDYLLGRNATGYCFLTGFGTERVMHPHHRPSMADGIAEPIPGLLSGGPNPGQQDKCVTYTSNFADESFTDDDCSYASNEIAINWNAPMVYLSAAIEALNRK
jgi:endoglucanase